MFIKLIFEWIWINHHHCCCYYYYN